MVHRRDKLRASKIMQERALDNPKIEMNWNHGLDEVLGDDKDGVTGVRLKSTVERKATKSSRPAACSWRSATRRTRRSSKASWRLTDKGYIQWTTPLRTYTSVEGVFAAGDVADNYYRQAITAAGTGCMAALDAERWLAAKGVD